MKLLTSILILTSVFACNMKSEIKKDRITKDYVLKETNGIFTEVFDSTNNDANRYTENNIIFRENTQFTYSFEHITKEGKKLYFEKDPNNNDIEKGWNFIDLKSKSENIIKKVKITVKYSLEPLINYDPKYNQTLLEYNCLNEKNDSPFYSISGAIENEKNVWIHPPRDAYFRILELNPFPFIKAPYKVGNKWKWQLNIGSKWSDKRWKIWNTRIENQYEYKITDKVKIQTEFGMLECLVVNSTAFSQLGKTELTSYFNEKYGFIKLNYVNIDRSRTNLELSEYHSGKTASNN